MGIAITVTHRDTLHRKTQHCQDTTASRGFHRLRHIRIAPSAAVMTVAVCDEQAMLCLVDLMKLQPPYLHPSSRRPAGQRRATDAFCKHGPFFGPLLISLPILTIGSNTMLYYLHVTHTAVRTADCVGVAPVLWSTRSSACFLCLSRTISTLVRSIASDTPQYDRLFALCRTAVDVHANSLMRRYSRER